MITKEDLTPSVTFAELEQDQHGLSDEFIAGAIEGSLTFPDGQRLPRLKSYFEKVPADASDKAFASSAEAVISFRDELADFIAGHVRIHTVATLPDRVKGILTSATTTYQEKLQRDKPVVANWIRRCRTGADPRFPESAVDFYGLELSGGTATIDLTEENNAADIQSNITIQRGPTEQFVRWSSAAYMRALMRGDDVTSTRRIYLNPTAATTVDIFTQVVDAAAQHGLPVKGKVYDHSGGVESGPKRTRDGKLKVLNAHGIVLYAHTDRDADNLLALVEQIYNDNYDTAFKGRKTPPVAMKIGDGIAVASEPEKRGTSPTDHVGNVVSKHVDDTQRQVGIRSGERLTGDRRAQAIAAFRRSWPAIATAAGINPNNLAFIRRR